MKRCLSSRFYWKVYSLQELKLAKDFLELTGPYSAKLPDLHDAIKASTTICEVSKALRCESLMCFALSCSVKNKKMALIRAQLGDITGKRVKESLIAPKLCEAARDLVK